MCFAEIGILSALHYYRCRQGLGIIPMAFCDGISELRALDPLDFSAFHDVRTYCVCRVDDGKTLSRSIEHIMCWKRERYE